MPRSRNVYNAEFPYHICVRNNDGAIYPCELKEAWDLYSNSLWFYSRIFNTRIFAFVLMKNHFHLLMATPNANLSEFMKYFLKRTSDDIRAINGVKNHLYGDRYYPTLVNNQDYFQNVYKYVYQNPVRAGICSSVLEYDYSTLPEFLGIKKMCIPIYDDYHFFDDLNGNLTWLDDVYSPNQIEQIQYGLKLQQFKLKPNRNAYLNDTQSK